MNALPHFRADVDGHGIHFIHVRGARGRGPAPMPLIITHGWPSSFVEMLPLIPLLADPAAHGGDPADAFDVVVPSVPGFGFSDRPTRRGMTRSRVAALWARLMDGLGYPRFAAHGNDIGAVITGWMAADFPDRLIAIHTMMPGFPPPVIGPDAPAPERRGARPRGDPGALGAGGGRLQPDPGDAAPDPRLRAPRLPGRAGRLDPREVAGLDRSGGRRGAVLLPRSPPRQRHALLGDRNRQRREPLLLRARPGAAAHHLPDHGADRRGAVDGSRPAGAPRAGRAKLRGHPAMDRVPPRRPLLRGGGAAPPGGGAPRLPRSARLRRGRR